MAARGDVGGGRKPSRNMWMLLVPVAAVMLAACASCKHEQAPARTEAAAVASSGQNQSRVRPPAVAGGFYPGEPNELSSMVKELLARAHQKKLPGPAVAIIVPHAGYIFSGEVAAYAFNAVKHQDINTVVLIGNSHHAQFDAASVGDYDAYRTPLGLVPVDRELVQALLDVGPPFDFIPAVHTPEHSLEVELPFLQSVLEDFKIVPIILGDETPELTQAVGRGIAKVLEGRKDFLLVCSTDMSHYPSYDDANRVDRQTIKALLALDESKLRETNKKLMSEGVPELHCTLCGLGAACATIEAAKRLGAHSAVLLKHANSGDAEAVGDRSRVVGYCAIAICGEAEAMQGNNTKPTERLNNRQQETLLRIAREAITAAVRGEKQPDWTIDDPVLQEKCGAFVTIKKHGQLRGCIGYIEPIKPLWQTVADVAVSAALNDYRFTPVSPGELPDLELEISALTPLRKMNSPDEIVIGKHGLLIEKGGYRGLLLPQVATEWGWDKWEFLDQTCRKAGLPAGAWKDRDAEVYLFSAQVFGEKEQSQHP